MQKIDPKIILNRVPKHIWILGLIIVAGIFLRTYNLHNWLYFYPDQARDIMLVDDVLSEKTSWPLLGPIAASTQFKLGPIYSYFQIISAKMFGSTPEAVAYPDVLFGVLSILLLYYFLRRFFAVNTSLILAGLYSISFYAVRYSRFAWNSNPIPFFALLFLISLLEFLTKRERTHWGWIISIGITLGIGVQLHSVMLVLLPATAFFACLYTMKKNWKVWRKWIFIVLIALVLNIPQIISENQTNFRNTRYFLRVLDDRSPQGKSDVLENIGLDLICNAQASTLFLSSINRNDSCEKFSDLRYDNSAMQNKKGYAVVSLSVCLGLLILLFGYWAMICAFLKEKDEKRKNFLGLMILYGALSFLILFPVIGANGAVRYLLPLIFMPFISLGFLLEYLSEKKSVINSIAILLLVLILAGTNLFAIISEAKQFAAKNRSNEQYVVLGEIEPMVDFIIKESAPEKEAYILTSNSDYFWNYFKPLLYVSEKNNFNLLRTKSLERVSPGSLVYYILGSEDNDYVAKKTGRQIEIFRNFGNIGIYKIAN